MINDKTHAAETADQKRKTATTTIQPAPVIPTTDTVTVNM